MNLNFILKGFVEYLKEQNLITEEEIQQTETNVDISIFSYSAEFKRYLTSELKIFEDITSVDFEQLLSMEIEEGQLVFLDNQEMQTLDEGVMQDENLDEYLGDEASLNEAQEEEILTQKANLQEPTEGELSKNLLVELINYLLKDENVVEAFDLSADETLDKEEIAEFLKILNEQDENLGSLSLDEVFNGIEQIQAEEGNIFDEQENYLEEEVEENPVEVEKEVLEGRTTIGSRYYSGGNNSSNIGGQGSSDKPKTLENMSKDELQAELTKAQGEVETKQDNLSSILDGSHSQIQTQNQNIEELYESYQEQLKVVDEDMAKKVDDKVQEISAKEAEISAKKIEISTQEGVISESEIAYNNALNNVKQLEASLSSLQSTDTSKMNDSQKNDLNSKITQLQDVQIPAAKDEQTKAEKKLEQDKAQLDILKTQQEEKEAQLEELETQKTKLEDEIKLKYPQVEEALEKYNNAKTDCDALKENLKETAQTELENARKRVSEVQAAINAQHNKEVEKEYSMSLYDEQEGQRLVESAYEMLNRYGSSSGYCARGVSRTMNIAYGISMSGHGYQWDTNMDKLVEQGMFTEVTSDYPTADLLSTLPAGAVVCWENTATSGGGGKQYGHVCIADGKGGEISDHYQANIYKSVGGRSDQYRIFIPV